MPPRYAPIGATVLRAQHGLVQQQQQHGRLLLQLHRQFFHNNNNNNNKNRQRNFHASHILRDPAAGHGSSDGSRNHYDTLNVHPDASPAEIKKSFYHLSKRHHPDHNPLDPHAGRRFMRISEAYATLRHAEKRARYDREHAIPRRGHHSPTAGSGSYHSTNPGGRPAGGRPASGLSSRRGPRPTTFTGPPPSFFRSGGWGAQGAKRRAAHEESTGFGSGGNSKNNTQQTQSPSSFSFSSPGMGPGQNPYRQTERAAADSSAPHFDSAAHERTHRRHDARRAERRAERRGSHRDMFAPGEFGPVAGFFLIAGIVAIAVMVPYVFFGGWKANMASADGAVASRRKSAAATASSSSSSSTAKNSNSS
ncbi:hypothetical protein B0T26DRAFT_671757 [Lasiosphaeria miniovina]|uniref:J domain-containing protein n=1 Tax=Lasiosphaeria miniovina TaxID=1954250 RepID=A0AA40B3N0_9PEZI|nr:uncharacterized protein B0T26DRAFT_671757 [Lasiosphaeria miniovina]KAK0727036.1 hypothetical protein B0T26DRAFT_671757 [Lasiosphaeria miniovina]